MDPDYDDEPRSEEAIPDYCAPLEDGEEMFDHPRGRELGIQLEIEAILRESSDG